MLSRSESIIFVRTLKRSFRLLKTKLFSAGLNHTSFLIQDDHKSKTSSSLNASSHLIPISWMSTYTYIRVTYPDQRWGAKSVIFFGAPSTPYKCQAGQKSEHLDATWHAHVRVGGHGSDFAPVTQKSTKKKVSQFHKTRLSELHFQSSHVVCWHLTCLILLTKPCFCW